LAVDSDARVHRLLALIQDGGEESAHLRHRIEAVHLEEPLHSELVEEMHKQLLALPVPHEVSEPDQLLIAQAVLTVPGLEEDGVNVRAETYIELAVQRLFIKELFVVLVSLQEQVLVEADDR